MKRYEMFEEMTDEDQDAATVLQYGLDRLSEFCERVGRPEHLPMTNKEQRAFEDFLRHRGDEQRR